jgi:hypothetical protein
MTLEAKAKQALDRLRLQGRPQSEWTLADHHRNVELLNGELIELAYLLAIERCRESRVSDKARELGEALVARTRYLLREQES